MSEETGFEKRTLYQSPIGVLEIVMDQYDRIVSCREASANKLATLQKEPEAEVSVIWELLDRYFAGERVDLSELPVAYNGTPFQQAIVSRLKRVPYGQTISYVDLAAEAGYPKAVRPAASTVARNPVVLFIPCHRVIRSDGTAGNYRLGGGAKQFLLHLEQGLV
ncbi:MAG: methylated-DNA--[protein]-cysteine S-methyltransferase [Spirochaetota bacterium]